MGLLSLAPRETRTDSLNGSTGLHPADPALADLWGGGINSRSNQYVTADTALAVSTVMACVGRVSKTLAMLPLNVMRRLPGGGHEIATKHRLYRQLSTRPNRWQTSYAWRMLKQAHVMLRGNAYSRIVPTPGRGMNELVPMDPDRTWPFITTPAGMTYYMYDNSPCPPPGSKLFYQHFPLNAGTEILTADEVLHIRGLSSNGIIGKNVVKLMRESIGLAMSTEEQGARLFSNGAQIGKVFKSPNKLSDIAYNRMKEWLKTHSGVEHAHETMILEEGLDIAATTLTMEDAQFLATRQFQVEDIASFLDVPLMLINRSGDKNQTFASAEQIFTVFSTIQMNPHYTNWEQELGESLLYPSEKDEYYIDFDTDAIMRGDSTARANFYKSLFGTASITIDEIRAKEHMSPLPDGQGDKVYIMSNMVPLSMAGQHLIEKTPHEGEGVVKQ
jgi:HK97 family phage portal protein